FSLAGVDPRPAGADYSLLQNSPNPFTGASTVRYRLGAAGPVKLRVFDVAGRQVASLVEGVQSAGEHTATLDGRELGAGVYQFQLECNGVVRTRKGILIR